MKQQLYEYATCFDEPRLAHWLHTEANFDQASGFAQQITPLVRESYANYFNKHFKDIFQQCRQYGVAHRLQMNQTPLMAAAAGNIALVEALLDIGADREAVHYYGHNA